MSLLWRCHVRLSCCLGSTPFHCRRLQPAMPPPPLAARGFYDKSHKPIVLTKKSVDGIQLQGGTILGTSRGGANIRWVPPARPHAARSGCLGGEGGARAAGCVSPISLPSVSWASSQRAARAASLSRREIVKRLDMCEFPARSGLCAWRAWSGHLQTAHQQARAQLCCRIRPICASSPTHHSPHPPLPCQGELTPCLW
jgi:hypothetical protein